MKKTLRKTTGFHPAHISEDVANQKNEVVFIRVPSRTQWLPTSRSFKSICLNFGIAKEFNGHVTCGWMILIHLRKKWNMQAIQKDVKWLGFDWEERLFMHPIILINSISGRFSL